MAVQTIELGRGINDPILGSVIFEIDYDDVSMLLVAVRCINLSSQPAYARAVLISNPNRDYSHIFPANTVDTVQIPTNPSGRMDVFYNPITPTKLDGVDYFIMWPA